MRYLVPLTLILVWTFALCACSSKSSSLMGTNLEGTSESALPLVGELNDVSSVSYYSMDIDLKNCSASITPSKELFAHYNVAGIMPVRIKFNGFSSTENIVDISVTLENISNMSGYDVRFIVYQNLGHNLINADAWTDRFDISGGLPINPFKAYAKSNPQRRFGPYERHTENLQIYIPNGNTNIRFAIDVSWPGNCYEPYEITNYFQGYLYDSIGSSAYMYVDVYDWQNNINFVALTCPQVTGQQVMFFENTGENEFRLDLINATGVPEGKYFGVISAWSSGSALYKVISVEVIQKKTIGVVYKDRKVNPGYFLLAPMYCKTIWLLDMEGRIVNQWEDDYYPGAVTYLLENGNILRASQTLTGFPGGTNGRIREWDWNHNLVWDFAFHSTTIYPHHDIERLPNGNTLILAWEKKTRQEALTAGRNVGTLPDSELWPDAIFEIKKTGLNTGEVVWEWHTWDHLASVNGGFANGRPVSTDISDPGKFNINYYYTPYKDWMHCNAVDYNPILDQIMVSNHNFCELFVIDHSTANYNDPQAGIEAARGPAGDIIYRWGNPRTYQAGTVADQDFYFQHDCQWIEPGLPGEGNILTFNNGLYRPVGNYSSIDEITPPVDEFGKYFREPHKAFGPPSLTWQYIADPPSSFYSAAISGAHRLPNGNTFICSGNAGLIFEVNPSGEIVWYYVNPVSASGRQRQGTTDIRSLAVFRCYKYTSNYPAFQGKDLTPGEYLELPRL